MKKPPEKKPSGRAENAALLLQIQQQMREICVPHYNEFYKDTTERGFTRITIPKTTQRSNAKRGVG